MAGCCVVPLASPWLSIISQAVVIECYSGRCESGRPRGVDYCEVSDREVNPEITRLAGGPTRRAARKVTRDYTWASVARQTTGIYERVVSEATR